MQRDVSYNQVFQRQNGEKETSLAFSGIRTKHWYQLTNSQMANGSMAAWDRYNAA